MNRKDFSFRSGILFLKKLCKTIAVKIKLVFSLIKAFVLNIKETGVKESAKQFVGIVRGFKKSHHKAVSRAIHYGIPMAAMAVILISVSAFSGVTLALEVNYSGTKLGYIADEDVFSQAAEIAKASVEDPEAQIPTTASYTMKLVNNDSLANAGDLSKAIIENTDALRTAYGLYANDKFVVACSTEETLSSLLKAYKAKKAAEYNASEVFFDCNVEIKQGSYLQSSISDTYVFNEQVLPLKWTVLLTTKAEMPFDTVTTKDATKLSSYEKVVSGGVKGLQETGVNVYYKNGAEVARENAYTTILQEPVNKQVVKGTKTATVSAHADTGARFYWPVARVSRSYVSCPFGGYSGHTGTDIAAPSGTQIYAAEAGVVESVSSVGGYGNHFVINHGNGVKTLYAHCSRVDVTVGQKVERGEAVAKVGSTGNSTGPHCHFEVHINGNKVNPASYLGI